MSCDEEMFKHIERINKQYPLPVATPEPEEYGYDPETNTFTVPITEITSTEKEPYYCPRHPSVAWDWHTNGRGKSVMGCPACSGVQHTARGVTGPIHRYPDAQYWRERELTKAEKDHKPRRGS